MIFISMVDFGGTIRHKMVSGIGSEMDCWEPFALLRQHDEFHRHGEPRIMDTSDFDKQAQQHLSIYHNVMNGTKIVIGLIILTLVVMAATLL